MNFSDSEIVASLLSAGDFVTCADPREAGLILINTCSIRDHAEQRVFKRLRELNAYRKKKKDVLLGVLGCMAERIKEELINGGLCDIVAGPDSYRDLPAMILQAEDGHRPVNVALSEIETYDDIRPVRAVMKGVSAFISIMRGCGNFCSYCVVPYTRGRERSRNPESILSEAAALFDEGVREISLLGQNVNSYHFKQGNDELRFPDLIKKVAEISPLLRVRFATSHPKDLSDRLLEVMASYENICRHIHLPVQSGSDRILGMMNRRYTSAAYLGRVEAIRKAMPGCTVSTDIITGFCSETEADHEMTLSLMKNAAFDFAFMFKYSERPGTAAAGKFDDDVPEHIKIKRLNEIISLQRSLSLESNQRDIGKTFTVLAEGRSKRSAEFMSGRNSQNKMVVFPAGEISPGEYTEVEILSCTSATLKGKHAK